MTGESPSVTTRDRSGRRDGASTGSSQPHSSQKSTSPTGRRWAGWNSLPVKERDGEEAGDSLGPGGTDHLVHGQLVGNVKGRGAEAPGTQRELEAPDGRKNRAVEEGRCDIVTVEAVELRIERVHQDVHGNPVQAPDEVQRRRHPSSIGPVRQDLELALSIRLVPGPVVSVRRSECATTTHRQSARWLRSALGWPAVCSR